MEGFYLCGESLHLCKTHFEEHEYCPDHKSSGHWKYWSLEDSKKKRVSKTYSNSDLKRVHYTCHHVVHMTVEKARTQRVCPILNDGGEKKP